MSNVLTPRSQTFRSFIQKSSDRTTLTLAAIGLLVLFSISAFRHYQFRSDWDLSIFVQGIYLISQGKSPDSTLIGIHMLADHVSFMLYPLAVIYRLFSTPYSLLFIQSLAIVLALFPLRALAKMAGLGRSQTLVIGIAYLLYPTTLFSNMFDFHPEVLTIPFFFGAILAARANRLGWFTLCLVIILSCRDALALNVVPMGLWLLWCERRRWAGAIAIGGGIAWFLIATKVIIPAIAGDTLNMLETTAKLHYGSLGSSFTEVFQNLFLRPQIVLGKIFSLDTVKYLLLLYIPVFWGLIPRYMAPLLVAIPTLAMNILADYAPQRAVMFHYDVPIVPFVFVAIIAAMAHDKTWLRQSKHILTWCCLLIVLGGGLRSLKPHLVAQPYNWTNVQADHQALTQVRPSSNVLSTGIFLPHLANRSIITPFPPPKGYVGGISKAQGLQKYDQILLSSYRRTEEERAQIQALIAQLKQDAAFKLVYEEKGTYLFDRQPSP
jgi:uncharacterized membrane protein